MLVLTRKPEERIYIGSEIVVTVLAVEGERVKLGISAPRDVQVLRGELVDEVSAVNRDAAVPGRNLSGVILEELARILAEGTKVRETRSEDSLGR